MRLQGAAILATSPSACTFLGAVMTFYNNFGDSYTSADRPRTSNEPPSDSVSRIEPKKPSRSSPIDSQGHRSRGATTKLASSTTSNSTGSSSTPNSTFGNNMSSSINYEGSSNITRSAVQPRARRPLIGRKGPVTAGPITRFSRDYCAYNSGNNFGAIPTPPTVVNLSSTTSMIPSASLLEIVANLPVKFDESSNDLKVTCKKVTDCGSGILHESVYSNNTDSLARRTLPSVQEPKEADRHIFNRSSERDSHRLGLKMFDHGRKNSLGPLDKSKDVYKANPVNHYHSLVTKCFGLTQNHQNFLAKNRDALSRTRLSGLQCISDREESNQVESQDILSESTLQSSLDRSEIASACSTQPRSISLCFQTPSAVPLESQAIWTFEDDKDEVDMMLRSYESVDFREKATKSYQENKDRKVNSSCIEREKEENELPHNTRKRSSYSFLLPSVSRPVTSATSRRAYTNSNVQNNSSQHFGLTQSKTGCEVLFLLHVMSVEISENSVSNLIVNGENNSNNQRQPIGKAIVCKVFRDYSHDLDSDIRLDFTGPFEKLSFGEIPSRCLSLATPPIAISDATKCQPSSQFNAAKYNFSWSTTAASYIFKLQKPFLTTGDDIEFTPSPQYPSCAWFEFQISCVKAEEGGDVTGSKGSGRDSSDLHQSQLTFGKYNPKDPKDGDSTDKDSEINTDIFIGSAFVNFDALVTQSGTIKLPLYSRNKSHNGGFPMSSELDKCGRTTTSCGGSLDDSVDTPIGTVSCSILVTVNEEECQKGIENFPTQVDRREAPVSENRNDVTDSIFVEIENPILESQEFLFPEAHTKCDNIVSSDSSISFRKQCVNTPPPQPNSGSFFRLRATTEAYVFTSTATPSSFFFSLYIMPLSSEMPSSFDVFKITLPTAEKPLLVNIREVTLQLLPPKREFSVSGIQCFRPDVVRLSYSLLNVLPPHTKVHRFFIAIVNCLNLPNLDAMGDPGNAYIRVRVVDANTEAKKSLKASIANVRCSTIFQTKTVLATKDPYFWGSTERPIGAASGTVADGGACFIIELTDSDVADFSHLEHPTQGENQMPDGKNKKVSPIPSLQFEVWDEEGGSDVIGESRATTCTSPISVLGTEGHTTDVERDSPCDMDTDSDLLDTTLINHLGIVRVSLADVIGIFHMPNGEFDKGKGSTYQLPLSLVTTPNFESNYTAGNTKCDMEEGEDTGGTTHHGTFLCSLTNSVTPKSRQYRRDQ